jgi:DNA-binding NarL/FixJ family response regulator
LTDAIRVALCDDHAVVRAGLRTILSRETDIEVVGEAGTAADAIRLTADVEPDVLVLDVGLPDASGLDAVRSISGGSSRTRVLILTMHDEIEYLREAFEAGAFGYLSKEVADVELVLAVRAVAEGKKYIHPTLGVGLLTTTSPPPARAAGSPLTVRETETLRLLGLGFTNQEISDKVHVSVRTIEAHRASIQRKLGLRSRADMVQHARDAGLLD